MGTDLARVPVSARTRPHALLPRSQSFILSPWGRRKIPNFCLSVRRTLGLASRGSALWVVFSCPLPSAQLETLMKTDLQERNKWTFISVCT